MLGADAKCLQPFEAVDPFHDDAPLQGFLCQRPDHRYGALALLRVDGHRVPQVIYATRKLHYPFGKDGSFHFPPIATCWNALETVDELTYETLLPLLLEEDQADDIEKFRPVIDDAIGQVRAEQEFRDRVRAAYAELTAAGLSITREKAAVMRALSPKFRRDEMGRVHSAILKSNV